MRPDQGPGPLRGPRFSTFRPDEVGWLLADYSHLSLERDREEREHRVQQGYSHYADDLPVETAPDAELLRVFDHCLQESAAMVAETIRATAAAIVASYGTRVTLVSLARAGVPVGIWLRNELVRRWNAECRHYAVSIVRDRGIDTSAMTWIFRYEEAATVLFVDGWTGKGAIRRELSAAVRNMKTQVGLEFPDQLAVLADPAGVADFAGTGQDILIPTACLNSTTCGLVSRTVLPRPEELSPYHGASQYPHLRSYDRSRLAIDTIDQAVQMTRCDIPAPTTGNHERRLRATRTVTRIARQHDITNPHLVKPGLGETTRVLQRRLPWRILVHPHARERPELAVVRLLAQRRNTPIEIADTGPYRCVGLIRPVAP